jgi:hypothetical protein
MRRPRDIGQELLTARAGGVPWKILSRRYKLSRSWLFRTWRRAAAEAAPPPAAHTCPTCGSELAPRQSHCTTPIRGPT